MNWMIVAFVTLATMLPVAAQSQPSACTKTLDNKPVAMDILNGTSTPFTVNFVDEKCNEKPTTRVVRPGERFKVDTFNGHAFRVREVGTNRVVREIVASPAIAGSVVVGTASPANSAGTSGTAQTASSSRPPSGSSAPTNAAPAAPGASAPTTAATAPSAGVAGMTPAAHAAAGQQADTTATALPIRPGQTLERGKRYVSSDGKHYLTHAVDGNLVVRTVAGDGFVWGLNEQRGVDFKRAQFVRMMPDGQLIAADTEGNVVWTPVGSDAAASSYLTLDAGVLKVVSPSSNVTWSSKEAPAAPPPAGLRVALPPVTPCVPITGYAKCRVIDVPRITIYGTSRVTDRAMDFVQAIYTDMTSRLTPAYPRSKLNFVTVVIDNGETAAELAALRYIGDNGRPSTGMQSNDWLRGGGGPDKTWVTEQMICKTGVATRGSADNTKRTYDQVIHEFAHTMDFRFNRRADIQRIYVGADQGGGQTMDPVEAFPYAMQGWFGAESPGKGFMKPAFQADLSRMFASATTYSCKDYDPSYVVAAAAGAPSSPAAPAASTAPTATTAPGATTAPTAAPAAPVVTSPVARTAPPSPPAGATQEGRFPVTAGSAIVQNQRYRSESGNHYLVFQPDGNVVVYTKDGQRVWGLNDVAPRYNEAKSVTLQKDGNLVINGANGAFIWSALNKDPDPSALLNLSPEGVLRLVSGKTGAILWSSGGAPASAPTQVADAASRTQTPEANTGRVRTPEPAPANTGRVRTLEPEPANTGRVRTPEPAPANTGRQRETPAAAAPVEILAQYAIVLDGRLRRPGQPDASPFRYYRLHPRNAGYTTSYGAQHKLGANFTACPASDGFTHYFEYGRIMTVGAALASKTLVPQNQPCDVSTSPHGR